MSNGNQVVISFREIGKAQIDRVGGKGANLGELAKMESVRVPDGFCISTEAFSRVVEGNASISELLDQLLLLKADNRNAIATLCTAIRSIIETLAVPEDIREEIVRELTTLGESDAYAVRSSATAEDLPTASFAGQQDSYLNVIGADEILKHVSKCWASLFTDRAVIYRIQNGFDHRKVRLAVVVQKMIFPEVSGILFTADPVNSNRTALSIDASFGLGESLVSGIVNADVYKVRNGEIIDKKISAKQLAIYAAKDGGTTKQKVESSQQNKQALTNEQIQQLEHIGRTIEAHFGQPQDIEWCLADDAFYIVQSRPITTLFPPPAAADTENRVYLSVGHQQMMTDAMKPLGLSFYLMITRAPMRTAAGRLFVDVTAMLASPDRLQNVAAFSKGDPLTTDALMTIVDRKFVKPLSDAEAAQHKPGSRIPAVLQPQTKMENDPAMVADLLQRSEHSLATVKQTIHSKSGTELFDFIRQDIQQLQKLMFDPQNMTAIKTGIEATTWLNEKMLEWLGEKGAADTLAQSAPNNVTSEMGLALLDVADVIRPYPEVIHYLSQADDEHFLDGLSSLHGGAAARDAINEYLRLYGMRCTGEIDITRPRWSERPRTLVPLILNNIKNFAPGEGLRKFAQGRQEALNKEQELLRRLRQLPDGDQKADETQRMISTLRSFIGYREYPKYAMISCYFVYKQALLRVAEELVQKNVVREHEDVFYLTFDELHEMVRTNKSNTALINKRKEEQTVFEKLRPPRVLTSEGEGISGAYKREHLPVNALIGLPVSSGIIEGRARVILNMEEAELEEGDILVTAFTDPSWTPLFVSIKGLVTEVGGLMTHGAVIAREYGLPAVVGMDNATTRIQDGQRIRVNGTDGYVEIL